MPSRQVPDAAVGVRGGRGVLGGRDAGMVNTGGDSSKIQGFPKPIIHVVLAKIHLSIIEYYGATIQGLLCIHAKNATPAWFSLFLAQYSRSWQWTGNPGDMPWYRRLV